MIDDATETAAAWIEEGCVIEGFRVGRLLGAGGMGQVYEAEQLAMRRTVAFKLIELPAAGADALARFEREARAAARVSHRNVVQIHECGRCLVAGRSFGWIAMEYVTGAQPIHAARAPASWRELVAQWIEPISAGLLACHQKGVIHRDVKPSNLLVGADGEVKLIDFGVARLEDATGPDRLTRTGVQPGTRAWMSPEQLEGRDVDLRTDVYSLGLVVGEILSGEEIEGLRVRAGGPFAGLRRAFRHRHPTLSFATAKELGWVVEKAAEWQRERRYASLADMGADLRRVLEGRPVLAARPTLWRSVSRFSARHKLVASLGAVLLSVLAAWFIGTNLSRHELWIERRASMLARSILLMSEMAVDQAAGPAGREEIVAALADVSPLRDERPQLREDLEEVRRHGRHRPARWSDRSLFSDALPVEGVWEYDDPSMAHMDGILGMALDSLDTMLLDFEPLLKSRLDLADRESAETIESEGARAGWLRVAQDLARGTAPYGDFTLQPQRGLVPVGRDAASGCLEFAVWGTGAVPDRDAAGRLVEKDETAIVMVLVPASSDASAPLPAFFIARSPLTPAQWRRLGCTEGEPVEYQDSEGQARKLIAGVRRTECATFLPSWRLGLPSEAQWRRAATMDVDPEGHVLNRFGLQGLGAKAWEWTADMPRAASDSAKDVKDALVMGLAARYRPGEGGALGTLAVGVGSIIKREDRVGVRPTLEVSPEPVRSP